jgi:hypothetical protein
VPDPACWQLCDHVPVYNELLVVLVLGLGPTKVATADFCCVGAGFVLCIGLPVRPPGNLCVLVVRVCS